MFDLNEDEPPLTPEELRDLRRARCRSKELLYAVAATVLLLIGVFGNPAGAPDARRTLCYIAAAMLLVAGGYRLRRRLLDAEVA